MSTFDQAGNIWKDVTLSLSTRPWSKRLSSGDLGLPHYKGFLIETYHNAGLNPQLQGYCSLYVKGRPRETIKKFFQHAMSEIGHDSLALSDLQTLGVDQNNIINSRPLPETSAFFANAVYNIQRFGAASYLAYLFHLEFTPMQNGPAIMSMLKTKGVPSAALTFLEEHSTVDAGHLKLMKTYMDTIIDTDAELKIFKDCLYDVMILHNRLLEAAFENGEKNFSI
ncbi:MAG: iron-containing redox enzyme family protein [Bdellovibrionales bacterium]|nr:iron-containing redox enzyme family protein [Bdellovibrionales bacterium]